MLPCAFTIIGETLDGTRDPTSHHAPQRSISLWTTKENKASTYSSIFLMSLYAVKTELSSNRLM